MPKTSGSLREPASAVLADTIRMHAMTIRRRMRRSMRGSPRGVNRSAALLGKLARETLGQRRRPLEGGEPPGPVLQRELQTEAALGRHIERQREAELADAVI